MEPDWTLARRRSVTSPDRETSAPMTEHLCSGGWQVGICLLWKYLLTSRPILSTMPAQSSQQTENSTGVQSTSLPRITNIEFSKFYSQVHFILLNLRN